MIHVSRHALDRAKERVPGVRTDDEARALFAAEVFTIAAQFSHGCNCTVRLATGNRVALRDCCVITVLPIENYRRTIRRHKRGRFE